MTRSMFTLSAVAVGLALNFASATPPLGGGGVEEWDEFEVLVEINATDGDAGLQGILDGDAWCKAQVKNPEGRSIFNFRPHRNLKDHGVTEIQWESNEPQFDPPNYTIDDFLDLFPDGEYTAFGKTIEGDCLESTADLTHDLPAGPNITSHSDGDEVEVDGSNMTIVWDEVTDDFRGGPLGSEIEGYIVVVEFEDDEDDIDKVLTIEATPVDEFQPEEGVVQSYSAEIPADYLQADREYKIEVGAVEESGNRTFTEITVCTIEPDA